MSGKSLYFMFALLFLSACANPKYAASNEMTDAGQMQEPGSCSVRFLSAHCVSYAWEKMPTEEEFGSFLFKTFRLNRADGTPVVEDLEGSIAVVLWMPSMGHGSSPVTVERLDTGTYRASNVFFTMRGDWDIRIQLKDGTNVKDQAIIPINL